jgi:hypothetical protein
MHTDLTNKQDVQKKLDELSKKIIRARDRHDWNAYNEYYRQYTELAVESHKARTK